MTKTELIENLNKITEENSQLRVTNSRLNNELTEISSQLAWHKNVNKTLLETMWAGAREGKFPRS